MTGRLAALTDALNFARKYTLTLLDSISSTDWFTMPDNCPSHIAWQVGHLALAEARLVFVRVCGRYADEASILQPQFVTLFGRTTVPSPDPAKHPSPAEIRAVMDRVHDATLLALRDVADADLDAIADGPPHLLCKTKGDFLRWAGYHEMIHAGQIGLIRRLLGAKPLW
jgi:hypothetical protein